MATKFNNSMLTTTDNPFDPFDQWEEWLAWDTQAGYNTPSYLARVTITSDALSEADQDQAIEEAMDEIVRENLYGVHKKVTRNDKTSSDS